LWPWKTCKQSITKLNNQPDTQLKNPCLEAQINQCCGTCDGTITQQQYRDSIVHLQDFLKGNHKVARSSIEEHMRQAATAKQFEKAGRLRDALQCIERLNERQQVSDTSGESTDYIGVAVGKTEAQIVILKERDGRVVYEDVLTLKTSLDDAAEILRQLLTQYYEQNMIPPTIALPVEITDSQIELEWLREL